MKKHFLFLLTLVLGLGQLFADEVTFSFNALKADNASVGLPFTWRQDPYHVSVTLGGTGTLTIANPTSFAPGKTITVSIGGNGTLNGITGLGNATASTGTNASSTWTPGDPTNSVTFSFAATTKVANIKVTYTPDPSYTPDVPVAAQPLVGPFEATPIEGITSYTGTDPYVFDMASRKYYAYNNLNQYEEFGLYPEVSTLKVAGGGVTEIEYIKSTNNAYINLDYIPKANSKAICTIDTETGGDWKAIYGCGYFDNGWKDRFCFFTTNATINLGGETGNREAMAYGRKIVTVLDAVAGKMDIFEADGTTLIGTITDSPKTADCKTPLYVFAQNKDVPGGNKQTDCYNMLTKLYGLQLYEGETLVMDLVPAINGEGKGGLKDKLTGTFYGSANNGEFELSADGQAMAGDAGISVYPGKLVINTADQHEYNWNGTEWVDLGSVYKPITDTNYQNMNNWTCRWGYDETYGHIENDGNNNFFNPYNGKGDWEPYQCKVEGLTKGETYRVSFKFSTDGWHSWNDGQYSALPVFATNNWDFGRSNAPTSVGGEVLGLVSLPKAAANNQPYSFTFTADGTEAVLAIQFGVGADNENFYFHFDNLSVEFVDYPQKYAIDWVDPNKYTPLAYIESTDAVRQNAFTTPYFFKKNSEIDTKFQSYGNGGWRAIFCGRDGSNTGISLYQNGNGADFGYFVGGYINDNFAPYPGHNQDITVAATLGNLNVDGTDYPTGRTEFNGASNPISLFANPGNDNPFRGRIYYFTIKEGSETIYDFQPVMRHDGKFGYYDAATKTFIQPAQGNWNGYGYQKLTDEAYMTYTNETRIVIVGTTAQFLPDVQNLSGATFTWTSSDETKATVDANGTVTGVAAGKVMITVTTDADQGWTASYELTVSEPNYVRKDVNNVGYAIITGGNGWGDSPVANLVDNDATTKFGCSDGGDAWAIIIASEPVAVQQYSFVTGADTYDNPGRTPRDWKLEGSNDNQTWTVIDQQEQNYKAKTANKEQTVFTVNGTDTYKFFKFTAGNFNGGFQLGELWINEQAHTWGEPTETASTCTVEGKKVWECTDCKALKTERLPLAAHTYENGVCTVCKAKVAEPILLANGQANDYIVKFRHKTGENNDRNIEEGWNTADFDDSAWDELVMPIGTAGYGVQHTIWQNDYNTFWFRRNFYVENPAAITKLTLKALHDDDYAIYVNGTQIEEAGGWTNGTEWLELNVDPSLLVAGNNVVAVYIEQNWGGAYCDFYLEGKAGATVTVSDAGYATFVAPCDVDFTGAEVTPKAATFDGEYVQLTDVTTVPAGTAVVVKADEGTYTVPATTDADLGTANELLASDDVVANGTQYILAKQGTTAGFAMATTGTTIPAGKGYLVISSPVKEFYPFFGDDATGINGINANENLNEAIFNVAGQRLSKTQKGINIVGGKKIVVK